MLEILAKRQIFRRTGPTRIMLGALLLIASSVVSGQAALVTVIEFFHNGLNHYFITGEAAEAAWLTANQSSLGWVPTGQSFLAYRRDANFTGVNPVCRFYGSLAPGPNSHFYTASANECAFLKQLQQSTSVSLPRWNFEELAFSIYQPSGGNCPAAAPIAVSRFFNSRQLQNDSNHRYVVDSNILAQMVVLGWTAEGIAMCAFAPAPSGQWAPGFPLINTLQAGGEAPVSIRRIRDMASAPSVASVVIQSAADWQAYWSGTVPATENIDDVNFGSETILIFPEIEGLSIAGLYQTVSDSRIKSGTVCGAIVGIRFRTMQLAVVSKLLSAAVKFLNYQECLDQTYLPYPTADGAVQITSAAPTVFDDPGNLSFSEFEHPGVANLLGDWARRAVIRTSGDWVRLWNSVPPSSPNFQTIDVAVMAIDECKIGLDAVWQTTAGIDVSLRSGACPFGLQPKILAVSVPKGAATITLKRAPGWPG